MYLLQNFPEPWTNCYYCESPKVCDTSQMYTAAKCFFGKTIYRSSILQNYIVMEYYGVDVLITTNSAKSKIIHL